MSSKLSRSSALGKFIFIVEGRSSSVRSAPAPSGEVSVLSWGVRVTEVISWSGDLSCRLS